MYDGMVWDQTYGDYGSFEEAQITTASKGADAMNPGLSMNLVIKSGSNTFRGSGIGATTRTATCRARTSSQDCSTWATRRAPTSSPRYSDFYGEIGGPILKDRLWFYASYRDGRTGHSSRASCSCRTAQQVEFFTKLENPTGKITWQVTKNNKFEWMLQVGRKWQPYRTREPLRAARSDAEPGFVLADRALVQVADRSCRSRADL